MTDRQVASLATHAESMATSPIVRAEAPAEAGLWAQIAQECRAYLACDDDLREGPPYLLPLGEAQ